MKVRQFLFNGITLIVLLALMVGSSQAQAPGPKQAAIPEASVGSAFTYQGYLTDGGNPASGAYDFQFILYDALSGGSQVGSMVAKDNIVVANGLFAVALDFGSVFDGSQLWLETTVRPVGGTVYTILSQRQEITPAPYAQYAIRANLLSAPDGDPANAVYVDNMGNVGIGTINPGAMLDVLGSIRSSNVTQIVVSPFDIRGSDNVLVIPSDLGYVYLQPQASGSQSVYVPVTIPTHVFGIEQKLAGITVCYQVDNAASYISKTEVYYLDNDSSRVFVWENDDDFKSTSWTCPGYYDPTPEPIKGAIVVRLWLTFAGTGYSHEIVIGNIMLRLTE